MNEQILNDLKKFKSLAEVGLVYASNEYDKERYQELHKLSLSLLSNISDHSIEALKSNFSLVKEYPTAKVDIRGLVLSDDRKILLVKESADSKWSLPGGWADIGQSPKEIVVKECKEETGLDVTVKALLAVFDKKMHAHPPQPYYVYKFVFYCEPLTTDITKGFDVLDAAYFSINDLPALSEDRILKSQIEMVYNKVLSSNFETYCD